jgi:hypothetical protein
MHARKNKTQATTRFRLRPLARYMAALFLVVDGLASATAVKNCNDTGAGSLRASVASAASGDTVDMSGLTTSSPGCTESRISLLTGEIKVKQNSLTIVGPGPDLVVTGKYYGAIKSVEKARIFDHTGTGTLALEDFSIRYGNLVADAKSNAYGGCIYSKGTVSLVDMNVSHCQAESPQYIATGGAITAYGVRIVKSVIENNSAVGGTKRLAGKSAGAYGGAVYVGSGDLYIKYSTITGNQVTGYESAGSAIRGTPADSYIRNTTIANNATVSPIRGSAVSFATRASEYTVLTLLNSTISNNTTGGGYALQFDVMKAGLYNSTIAFNEATGVNANRESGLGVIMESVILSNNQTYFSGPQDFYAPSGVVVGGSHNLVFASSSKLPDDTIMGKCPLLTALRNDGGLTSTLMPGSGSPAIDAGNNVYNSSGVDVDQRGVGYPRSSGPPDVGAYEVQQDEVIFNSDFEGCP